MDIDERPLCALCRDVNLTPWLTYIIHEGNPIAKPASWNATTYRVTPGDLKASADAGCPWCIRVALADSNMPDFCKLTRLELGAEVRLVCDATENASARLVTSRIVRAIVKPLHDPPRDPKPEEIPLSFAAKVVSDEYLSPALDHKSATCLEYRLDTTVQWMRECWQECITSHDSCSAWENSPLPTRVLDVSDTGGDTAALDSDVRVHLSAPGEKAPYTALSYCWGGPQKLKLTSLNIDRLTRRIRIVELPQAIKEAVCFTRLIGVRYIWIDAFCILQDSHEDKRREIRNMRNIFQNTYVTIIAYMAASVYESFVRGPKIFRVNSSGPHPLPLALESYRETDWRGFLGYAYFDEPVNRRAWTLEERLLSPRLVIFSQAGPIWQCQTKHLAMGDSRKLPWIEHDFDEARIAFARLPSAAATQNVSKIWCNIVEDFSGRAMTRSSDKFLALAGVAEAFQKIAPSTLGEYCVGIWKKLALEGLSWSTVSFPEALKPKPAGYRAPSWSWAAIDDGVRYIDIKGGAFVAQLVEMHVDRGIDSYEFGAALSGHVVLRAPTIDGFWTGGFSTSDVSHHCRAFATDPHTGEENSFGTLAYADYLGVEPRWTRRAMRAIWLTELSDFGLILEKVDEEAYARVGSFFGTEDEDVVRRRLARWEETKIV